MPTTLDAYDTVIVGGGLAGAIVARRLAAASQKVVLLEAREAVGGAAPHGAGLALLGTPEPYTGLQTRLGDDGAQRVWELTRENLALLSHALETAGLEVQRTGSLRLTDDAQEAQQFQQSAALLSTLGYSITLEDTTGHAQRAALHTQDDIGYDPSALIAALLDHPNITLETEAEVQAIKPQPGAAGAPLLTIWARKHYLWAKAVVLTGGAHAVRLTATLRPWLHPTRCYSMELVTDMPLPVPLIMAGGQIVVLAEQNSWRMVAWTPPAQPDALNSLLNQVTPLCPQAIVRRRRSEWIAQSEDGLPVVGVLPEHPNIYLLNGLGPWGASWAFAAAERLVELILHQQDPGWLSPRRFS